MAEDNLGNRGYLSDAVNEDGLYPIHGIAIGNNDITVGHKSGEPKLWRPEVLEEAADTLEGRDIVVNHENQDAYKKIGEVEESKYDEEKGVLFRGAIDDDDLAEKISRDWLEVSPRIKHSKAHEELQGVKVPEYIQQFDNLSVVRRGAAKSNELTLEEVEELSIEELQESFDENHETEEAVSEYQNIADDDIAEEFQEDINFARWMFKDENGAVGANEKFGCDGTHSHTINGETWYMPCSTHDKFLEGLKDTQNGEMSYSEGDVVRWDDGVGKVIECSDSGVYDGSVDNDDRVKATEDDPAALIEPYEIEEGSREPTDEVIGKKFSELEVEELQLSEARTPEYDGTEETSWGDVSKDLSSWVDALEYDGVETVDDLNESQRQEVANHTLLGDPEGETWDEVSYFPVVNPNTGSLNRGALEAVRGGRGQSADISNDTWESAASVAGELLEDEFDADVPDVDELAEHADEMSYKKEELRIASQLASYSTLTKNECLSMIDILNPNKGTDVRKMAELVESVMEEGELEKFLSMLKGKEAESDDVRNDSVLNNIF